jgi:hypothetical protein
MGAVNMAYYEKIMMAEKETLFPFGWWLLAWLGICIISGGFR